MGIETLHSFILAQVLGLYLVIMAVIMLVRGDYYRKFIHDLKPGSSAITVAACFGLLLGLLMLVVHNLWGLEPRILVTLVGWIILIKSLLWLALPERMTNYVKKMSKGSGYYVALAVEGILGILLLSKGFFLFM